MGFGKFIGKIADSVKEANEVRKENNRIREQIEQSKRDLLEKFDFPQLKGLCRDVLGREPDPWKEDRSTGKKYKVQLDRYHYIEFIVKEFELQQIQNYATKRHITPNVHSTRSVVDAEQQHDEFEEIKNTVKTYFIPEPVTDEEHFKAQLAIFLKARFPSKDVQREVKIKSGFLDILIDGTYAIEAKLPHVTSELRNAEGQIADYKEEFSNLWLVILDVGLVQQSVLDEYQEKYKTRYKTSSIIIQGRLRN